MGARFHIQWNGRLVPIEAEVVVGRSADADICIDDLSVSRRHARIRPDEREGGVWVEDLGARNRVTVGGDPILRPTLATHQTEIRIGSATMFVVDVEKTGAPTIGPPPLEDAPRPRSLPTVATSGVMYELLQVSANAMARFQLEDAARALEHVVKTITDENAAGRPPEVALLRETRRLVVRLTAMTADTKWLARLAGLPKIDDTQK